MNILTYQHILNVTTLTQLFHHGDKAHTSHEGIISCIMCPSPTIQTVACVALLYSELWWIELAAEITVQVAKGSNGDVHTEKVICPQRNISKLLKNYSCHITTGIFGVNGEHKDGEQVRVLCTWEGCSTANTFSHHFRVGRI